MTDLKVEDLGGATMKVRFRDHLGVDWEMVHGPMVDERSGDAKAGILIECSAMKVGGRDFVRMAWVGGGA